MRKLVFLNPTVHCLGVASDLGVSGGQPVAETSAGPEAGAKALVAAGAVAAVRQQGMAVSYEKIDPNFRLTAGNAALSDLLRRLARRTAEAVRRGDRVLVLGGDHAMAAGTWRGVARGLGEAPGLIWIDAHLDAHTPDDSPTGNRHGMPLAALLGEGEAALCDIPGAPLDSARVAVIGARSFEASELARLERLGVRVYFADEVAARGLPVVFADARRLMAGRPWGISLDLDVLDPAAAPGVSTPVPGGLGGDDLRSVLRGVLRDRCCVGLELAEYNPGADQAGVTARRAVELIDAAAAPDGATLRRWEAGFGARNYAPLPVVLRAGKGCWLSDVDGHRYLDLMAAYSATSFGHGHPRLLAALTGQAARLAVTSRAFFNDRLPLFMRRLALLTGYERVLPVNTGLEAVETALKAARKWAYRVKGVPEGEAEIVAAEGNFHGRSIAIVGLSSEAQYRAGFGPFPPGLRRVPYGDPAALAAAITPATAAFLVEPIQGEGGIVIPPPGYLAACAAICRRHNVLLIADEVQTGLGRTGRLLACEHDGVRPDGVILGKALGGGLLPVSAFLADEAVMGVFSPGDHGSTFGGNPLAAAVALAALDVLEEERLVEHSARLGERLLDRLVHLQAASPLVRAVRGRGLFAAIELDPALADARVVAEWLLGYGVLTKDTHATVLRLAPPLVIDEKTLAWGVGRIARGLSEFCRRPRLAA